MSINLLSTLICDDARTDITKKLNLVGVYNYVIGFLLPAEQARQIAKPVRLALPKLTVVFRWFVDSRGHKVKTRILDPHGNILRTWNRELPVPKDGSYDWEILNIADPIFVPGTYKIVTSYSAGNSLVTSEEPFNVCLVIGGTVGTSSPITHPVVES